MLLTVDAAIVGIGRARWCAIDEDGATEEAARVTMGARRFDVLPIEPRRGPIREFFRTEEWNDYSRVSRCRLTYVETLPAETPIREVIRGLAEQERRFFFLTLNGTVGGLISIANLNSRPVRMYLFGLLSEFERRLGTLVTARDESGLVAETLNSPKVRGHYARDRKRGIDAAPIEYLGLSDLLIVARRLGLIRELDLATPHRLDFTELRDLRNRIAHPIKTLTTGGGSVASLWDMVSLLEEMIFGLRQLQGAED